MAAETGFLINDELYEVPILYSLDGDECALLYDYSGLAQEDFAPLEDETEDETAERNRRQMRHPGFWQALMHIAYRRKHREMKDQKIRELVGRVNRMEALATVAPSEPEEADVVPPALTSEQPAPSVSGSLESETLNVPPPVNGGDGSTNGSDDPDRIPAPIGTIR